MLSASRRRQPLSLNRTHCSSRAAPRRRAHVSHAARSQLSQIRPRPGAPSPSSASLLVVASAARAAFRQFADGGVGREPGHSSRPRRPSQEIAMLTRSSCPSLPRGCHRRGSRGWAGRRDPPDDLVRAIGVPTLVVAGGASPDFFRDADARLTALLPNGRHTVLQGGDHGAPADVVAPVARVPHRFVAGGEIDARLVGTSANPADRRTRRQYPDQSVGRHIGAAGPQDGRASLLSM